MQSIDNLIFSIINNSKFISIQNILLGIPDRHIALAVSNMDQNDKERILTFLPLNKQNRINDEIKFMGRITVNSKTVLQAKQLVLSRLNNDKKPILSKGYIRRKP